MCKLNHLEHTQGKHSKPSLSLKNRPSLSLWDQEQPRGCLELNSCSFPALICIGMNLLILSYNLIHNLILVLWFHLYLFSFLFDLYLFCYLQRIVCYTSSQDPIFTPYMVDDGSRGLHMAKDHGNPKRENDDFMCLCLFSCWLLLHPCG